VESRPSVADSLVKNNSSTQSLGSHSTKRRDSQQTSYSSALSSPTSSRSEKSFSDSIASASARDSESIETEGLENQTTLEDSRDDTEESSTAQTADDILTVNVAPHDRSRTLPGILPHWDSSILWSLSRVLSTKKADPPLDSDSSDSDSSEETQTEEVVETIEPPTGKWKLACGHWHVGIDIIANESIQP
jgi:hypothetical protein